jgi:hypothetical protein
MADDLTLMAVHAHPDDESSSTGGVLAAYGDQGVRTVVVTCTNGEFGDAPGGVKPGQDGPRRAGGGAAAARRAARGLQDPGRHRPRAARLPRLRHAGLGLQGPAQRLLQHPYGRGGRPDHRADRAVPAAGRDHLRSDGPLPAPRPRARGRGCRLRRSRQRHSGQALLHGAARQRLAEGMAGAARRLAWTCPTGRPPTRR